ncbi:hypothetical protein OE903_16615 [Bacillus sp. B6(2022)]|nr:hypothetical protein [Bacillus sp. B6(2022)]
MDTIAAISTPMGEGAIAIIRLSGPDAVQIADRMYKGPKEKNLYQWILIQFIMVIL